MSRLLVTALILLASWDAQAAMVKSAAETETPTPTATPTATPNRARLSFTRTATPNPSATRTPLVRPTLRPTATAQATATVLPTPWIYDRSQVNAKGTPHVPDARDFWQTPGIRKTMEARK